MITRIHGTLCSLLDRAVGHSDTDRRRVMCEGTNVGSKMEGPRLSCSVKGQESRCKDRSLEKSTFKASKFNSVVGLVIPVSIKFPHLAIDASII